VGGTIRLLRNIMGLWLVQEARRTLGVETYAELAGVAEQAPPFTAFIDPDDPRFLRPGDVPSLVRMYCEETDQPAPRDGSTLIRILLESLTLKYAFVMRQLECVTGSTMRAVRVVGGGSQHALLCRLAAGATGVPVIAGPAEATSIGNIVVQAIASGQLGSIAEAREVVDRSFPARCFEPEGDWTEARARFDALLRVGHTGGT
jgi:rhamnulokinase